MKNEKTITWTPAMLARLKARMIETAPEETFTFDGNLFLRAYAKYLVEYLDEKFGKGMNS